MAYEKLNLKDGNVFSAAHVAHMENGIVAAQEAAEGAAQAAKDAAQTAAQEISGVKATVQEASTTASAANDAAEAAKESVAALEGRVASISTAALPTVYCWGDSLTEGVGGWLATPESVQKVIVSAYPDVVSKTYPVVNLGCRGETIQTIMARQGADPMVVGGFTIPASAGETVIIGYQRGNYYAEDVLGLATASGDTAQPLKECEAGVNPCTIAGVEGVLLRDGAADSEGRHAYRFQRLADGAAVVVPEGTQVETYAMKHYRNGVAVIWMGANGAVSSHAAYLEKISAMVEYGQYQNYVVLLCREYAQQWVLDDANSIEKGLTDADGTCHLLYLKPELLRRGYNLAGIAASTGVPNTSSWTNTTDEIKLQCPLLMASTGSAEADYETLHFSCYGYKAIGKLVVEKLGQMIGVSSGTGGSGGSGDSGSGGGETPDSGVVTNGTDDYGEYAYKLTKAKTGAGIAVYTGYKPYDVEKNWTILCKFADGMTPTDGSMGSIFEMREFFTADSKQTAVYLRKIVRSEGTVAYNFAGGFGGFDFPYDNAPGYAASEDGYHYAAIIKNGGNYSFYLDGGLAYGAPLGYEVAEEHLSQETLRLFGRVENGETYNTITGEIADFRIYNGNLDVTTVNAIIAEMKG